MKKGFTLIELLAVIVILAIIAVIATPIILGGIEKSKKGVRYNVNRYNRKIRCETCNCNYCRIHNGRFGCTTKITKGKNSCKSKYIKPEDIDKFLTKTLKTFLKKIQYKNTQFFL